jgi:hypothetical protein
MSTSKSAATTAKSTTTKPVIKDYNKMSDEDVKRDLQEEITRLKNRMGLWEYAYDIIGDDSFEDVFKDGAIVGEMQGIIEGLELALEIMEESASVTETETGTGTAGNGTETGASGTEESSTGSGDEFDLI